MGDPIAPHVESLVKEGTRVVHSSSVRSSFWAIRVVQSYFRLRHQSETIRGTFVRSPLGGAFILVLFGPIWGHLVGGGIHPSSSSLGSVCGTLFASSGVQGTFQAV